MNYSLKTMMSRCKAFVSFPWHPFITTAAILVAMMSACMYYKEPGEFLFPFFYLEFLTGILFALAVFLLKDPWKAANTVTVFLVLLYSYRPVFLEDGRVEPSLARVLLWLFFTVWIVFFTARHKLHFAKKELLIDPKAMSNSFAVASIALLLMYCIRPLYWCDVVDKNDSKIVKPLTNAFDSLRLQGPVKPDIYFLLVDGLANDRTFSEYWKFDSSYFTKALKSKGFYIVDHARSNYHETCVSVPSEFNMQYLDTMIAQKGPTWPPLLMAWRSLQNAAIYRILKNNGYRIVNIADGDSVTQNLKIADSNLRGCWWNEALFYSVINTPLIFLDRYVHVLTAAYVQMSLSPESCLDKAIAERGPKFVMIHTNLVHPPGLIDRAGHYKNLSPSLVFDPGQPSNYIEQFRWGEPKLERWIDKIQEKTNHNAIIIVQSDHGTYYPPATVDQAGKDWYYNERMRIVNAIYLPNMNNKGLYDWMTPVNTFRVILNDYFDAKLPLLPDKVYCHILPTSEPLDVTEVTDRLHW